MNYNFVVLILGLKIVVRLMIPVRVSEMLAEPPDWVNATENSVVIGGHLTWGRRGPVSWPATLGKIIVGSSPYVVADSVVRVSMCCFLQNY